MIRAILFDLGGVLVKLGDSPIPAFSLTENQTFTLKDWFTSNTAQRFEKGLISPDEFIQCIKQDLDISTANDEIRQHFTAWPKGLFNGTTSLLKELQGTYPLFVLSNSNELHWPRITKEFGLEKFFERMFASHLINMAKPNEDIYLHVIDELKFKAEEFLFFDDNKRNVDVAAKLGMQSYHVNGVEELRLRLKSLQIVK